MPSSSLQIHWPQQSPVDISKSYYTEDLPPLKISYPKILKGSFDYEKEHPNFLIADTCKAYVSFQGVDCYLKKIHFHSLSEHKINGVRYPIEAHFLHKIPNFPEESPSALLVLSVFFSAKNTSSRAPRHPEAVATDSPQFASFARSLPFSEKPIAKAIYSMAFTLDKGNTHRVPTDNIFPKEAARNAFYRYEGSLTSPYYAEYVSWVLFKEHVTLSGEAAKELERSAMQPSRECHPLNRRYILRNFR